MNQSPLRSTEQLHRDALAIWQAGVDAVRGEQLIHDNLTIEGDRLQCVDESIDLAKVRRIVVVGAGKAGASMATGLEEVLGGSLMQAKQLTGWVNVPADCVRSLSHIRLHPARPAGQNEPTEAGVQGTHEIIALLESLTADDLCFCLLSGGGSALLPAPAEGVSLDDKLQVTQFLSAAGANIDQLNTVRKQLSRVKGGRLAGYCKAGRMVTLILSDVPGNRLDLIASGPTVPNTTTAADALVVLQQFDPDRSQIPQAIWDSLQSQITTTDTTGELTSGAIQTNWVIGNNAVAVDAAGTEAVRRGYSPIMTSSSQSEPTAEEMGNRLTDLAFKMQREQGPDCAISGGEPVVTLAPAEVRGKGGRNQQLVLAALQKFLKEQPLEDEQSSTLLGIVFLSGGTDGEDGPTDAAGAMIDRTTTLSLLDHPLKVADYLARNDAYHFFRQVPRLLETGPTHTNVCDLRVVLVDRVELHHEV